MSRGFGLIGDPTWTETQLMALGMGGGLPAEMDYREDLGAV